MAALVQTLPSPTTAPMMSGQPSSASGYTPAQGLPHGYRQPSTGRYKASGSSGYRGMPPYAFTSTPQLSTAAGRTGQSQPGALARRSSAQDSPTLANTLSLDFSGVPALDLSLPMPASDASSITAAAKPSPDRYRRNVRRIDSGDSSSSRVSSASAIPSGSGMAAVGPLYSHPSQTSGSPTLSQYQTYRGSTYASPHQLAKTSADDTIVGRSPAPELAARYRRRSLGSIETVGLNHTHDGPDAASPHPNTVIQQQLASPPVSLQRPSPTHAHKASSDSVASSRSGRSSRPGSARNDKGIASPAPAHLHASPAVKQDTRHLASPRPSELAKRIPSPLSRPVNINGGGELVDETPRRIGGPRPHAASSAAVEQLASVNEKIGKKPKSKLRRAFSFGSTMELRKATVQANLEKSVAANSGHVSERDFRYNDELEPEQARIAEKQEAAGLGESIYSGQGNFFTGSTDNLSISSTASSASLMLRKMGHGVKKGTRSFVGLFRPKSIIGPSPDGPAIQAPVAEVSMVTVEAEREVASATVSGSVNGSVSEHLDSLDQSAAVTNFLKLERDSIDTGKFSVDSTTVSSDSRSRRSIVGGERERAEVLAAVKKGILKRSDSNQPSPRLAYRQPDFSLPLIPALNDSPRSSAPSTPADEPLETGHKRTDSIAIEDSESDGYFASVTHFATMDSMPVGALTPQSMIRNISFSPRIQFHDTWPSAEYDRRGDIATCNRLTPMLAQQIKEELNTFKMEMEVHESSKVYTHFF